MRPAESQRDGAVVAPIGQRAEAAVAVHLQGAAEGGEVRSGPDAFAVGGVDVGDRRRPGAAAGTVVGSVGPDPAVARPAPARREGGQRRVVGEHPRVADHMGEDQPVQRPEPPAGLPHPVAERRAVEADAAAGQDPALAVQGQPVAVLRDQDLRQRRLGRQAAGDDACRCRRLVHAALLAAAAGVAGPDGDADPELDGHHVEPLGPVLADLMHLAPAAGTGAVGDVDHLLDPLQVRRQRTAVAAPFGGGLAVPFRGVVVVSRRRGRIRPEEQRELAGIDALGAAPEACPP